MLKVEVRSDGRVLCDENGQSILRLRQFSELAGSLSNDIFVVASGPSVKNVRLEKYGEYPFIAMNGSILACVEAGVSPFFYLCDDSRFTSGRMDLALQGLDAARHVGMSLEVLSAVYQADRRCLDGKSIFLLEHVNRFAGHKPQSDRAYAWSIRKDQELLSGFSLFRQTPNRIGFSLNLDKGYFVARTIPYVALQLCYQLGCSRVFMLGVDMNQGAGRFYENGTSGLFSRLDKDYKRRILPSFRFAAKRAVEKGRFEVFNLSLQSRIPDHVVPKLDPINLDSLLDD